MMCFMLRIKKYIFTYSSLSHAVFPVKYSEHNEHEASIEVLTDECATCILIAGSG